MLATMLKAKKLTQVKFGEMLDPPVKQPTVSKWLRGLEPVPESRYRQIAELLGVDPETMASGTEFVRTEVQKDVWRLAVLKHMPDIRAGMIMQIFPVLMRDDGEVHIATEDVPSYLAPRVTSDDVDAVWPMILNSPFVIVVQGARWVFKLKMPDDL